MGIIEKVLGPKSKYDASLPYTYEARVRIFEEGDECKSYFADTLCGLVDYLRENGQVPAQVAVIEIYREREVPLDTGLLVTPEGVWMSRREICRAFEERYPGHIRGESCDFEDRDGHGTGP